jgi:hypothetical protein
MLHWTMTHCRLLAQVPRGPVVIRMSQLSRCLRGVSAEAAESQKLAFCGSNSQRSLLGIGLRQQSRKSLIPHLGKRKDVKLIQ